MVIAVSSGKAYSIIYNCHLTIVSGRIGRRLLWFYFNMEFSQFGFIKFLLIINLAENKIPNSKIIRKGRIKKIHTLSQDNFELKQLRRRPY